MFVNHFDNHLIALEGIDGTGKTTLSQLLTQKMNEDAVEQGKSNLDTTTREFLIKQLKKRLTPPSLERLLASIIFGGAIRFEDLKLKDSVYHAKSNISQFNADYSLYTYLLSAIQKDHIVRTLLPYTSVVTDRYIYSVMAHHIVIGASIKSINIDHLPITRPDFLFLLKAREDIRVTRIASRGIMDDKDRRRKDPGSVLERIEHIFDSFTPEIIDTTHLNPEDVAEIVSSRIKARSKKESLDRWRHDVSTVHAAFNNDRYLALQSKFILKRIRSVPTGGFVYIEFGGKTYDDQHAARVLPGYDPNAKVKLLKNISGDVEIVVAVSARDLLKPRIRGDSQLFYTRETLRLVGALNDAGISTNHGVVTMVRDDYTAQDNDIISSFLSSAKQELGIDFEQHGFIAGYPNPQAVLSVSEPFKSNRRLKINNKNILVLSPGGGSGKFCICISQLYHDFVAGYNSMFLKFETFPVCNLATNHPINLAFAIASADLGNTIVQESQDGMTSYDKDMENFKLLMAVTNTLCPDPTKNPVAKYIHPSSMGVNKLTAGFIDEDAIKHAAMEEIKSRIQRYKQEIAKGLEKREALAHIKTVLSSTLNSLLDLI